MSSPRNVPGFYYDANRNRYFPISSGGGQNMKRNESTKGGTREDECKSSQNVNAKVLQILSKREIGVASRLGNSRTSSAFKHEYLETQASKPWVWSYGASSSADGAVEEFHAQIQTIEGLKEANVLTWGNSNSLVGVCEVLPPNVPKRENVLARPAQIFPWSGEPVSEEAQRPPDLLLSSMRRVSSSKITAIKKLRNVRNVNSDILILTTLGSGYEGGAIFLLKQRHVNDGSWHPGQHLPLETVKCVVTDCSVWTAAYCAPAKATLGSLASRTQDQQLAAMAGTSKGAALVHLEASALRWLVKSKSDVLAQQCDLAGNLLFCGFRNGYISMVDIRSSSRRPSRMPLMQMSPLNGHARQKKVPFRDKAAEVAKNFCESFRMRSAVCSLMLLQSDETYLLASALNADINLWDRRLFEKGPVLTYEGHQNSHSLIALGVDSSESLLVSGGEDQAIRIWSLRTGKLLQTISGLPAVVQSISSTSLDGYSSVHPSIEDRHAWKMWLGSSAGLMYLQGSARSFE